MVKTCAVYGGVLLLLLLVLFPFYWMTTASIKNFREISIERTLIPREITFQNYVGLFEQTSIMLHLFNTAWISVFVTVVTMILASMCAYVLTRFLTPTAELIARVSLYAYMVPSIVLIIPFYIGLRMAGLVNSHAGLILSYLSFTLPLGIWMMRACFQTIPKTMEEAAVVDGAKPFRGIFPDCGTAGPAGNCIDRNLCFHPVLG